MYHIYMCVLSMSSYIMHIYIYIYTVQNMGHPSSKIVIIIRLVGDNWQWRTSSLHCGFLRDVTRGSKCRTGLDARSGLSERSCTSAWQILTIWAIRLSSTSEDVWADVWFSTPRNRWAVTNWGRSSGTVATTCNVQNSNSLGLFEKLKEFKDCVWFDEPDFGNLTAASDIQWIRQESIGDLLYLIISAAEQKKNSLWPCGLKFSHVEPR